MRTPAGARHEGRLRRGASLIALALLAPACSKGDGKPTTPSSPGSASDTWTQHAALLEPRQEVAVAELGGRIYVAGGFRSDRSTANTVEVYDPGTNSWSFAAPMPVALNHAAAAAVGSRLYVIGGSLASGGAANATLEYDPARNEWSLRSPMPTARSAPVAGVIGGVIYVAGGAPARQAFEAFDPASDLWSRLPSMPTPRDHVAGGVIGGRFYAVGGRPPLTLNVLEVFDPQAASWSRKAPMPMGRSGHAAAVVRGCLYVFGGEGNASLASGVFPQNEVYDPRRDTWEALAAMTNPRHGIGAAVTAGRIHIPGGASVQGFGVTAVHDAFTPAAGRSCE